MWKPLKRQTKETKINVRQTNHVKSVSYKRFLTNEILSLSLVNLGKNDFDESCVSAVNRHCHGEGHLGW